MVNKPHFNTENLSFREIKMYSYETFMDISYIHRQKRELEKSIKEAERLIGISMEGKVSLRFALLVVSDGLKSKKKCNFMKFNTFITRTLNINL